MRPTIAEIDLSAIRHNVGIICSLVSPKTSIMAIVKANAYGHGARKVSAAAISAGASSLGVAIPEEGAELREDGFKVPIFVIGLILPDQASLIVQHDLIATVSTIESARAISEAAGRKGRKAQIMVKIDTGMGRVGIRPELTIDFIEQLQSMPNLIIKGIFTHFATADSQDKTYAYKQLNTLRSVLKQLEIKKICLKWISMANSAAILNLPQSYYNLVRPGIILYGLSPFRDIQHPLGFRPAMQFKTKIVYLKEVAAGTKVGYGSTYITPNKTYLATLPVGYADGYSRQLSNKASVLIGGRRYPVVGQVCMDQIMVDLGTNTEAKIGDEVVLFGRQKDSEISVNELAELAGTINYEMVCAVSPRVPRVYLNE